MRMIGDHTTRLPFLVTRLLVVSIVFLRTSGAKRFDVDNSSIEDFDSAQLIEVDSKELQEVSHKGKGKPHKPGKPKPEWDFDFVLPSFPQSLGLTSSWSVGSQYTPSFSANRPQTSDTNSPYFSAPQTIETGIQSETSMLASPTLSGVSHATNFGPPSRPVPVFASNLLSSGSQSQISSQPQPQLLGQQSQMTAQQLQPQSQPQPQQQPQLMGQQSQQLAQEALYSQQPQLPTANNPIQWTAQPQLLSQQGQPSYSSPSAASGQTWPSQSSPALQQSPQSTTWDSQMHQSPPVWSSQTPSASAQAPTTWSRPPETTWTQSQPVAVASQTPPQWYPQPAATQSWSQPPEASVAPQPPPQQQQWSSSQPAWSAQPPPQQQPSWSSSSTQPSKPFSLYQQYNLHFLDRDPHTWDKSQDSKDQWSQTSYQKPPPQRPQVQPQPLQQLLQQPPVQQQPAQLLYQEHETANLTATPLGPTMSIPFGISYLFNATSSNGTVNSVNSSNSGNGILDTDDDYTNNVQVLITQYSNADITVDDDKFFDNDDDFVTVDRDEDEIMTMVE